ncbi:MAG: large repetitive protein, partial [Actinomycetota bacterium]|nr:large repetitive protein [Actinomycetota bacterium]
MRNSVCKTLPLAIAFLLVVVGTAFAGQNAGVTFALDSPAEFTGIGPGNNTVTFTLSAAAVVGVKQYDVTVKVTPADAFDLNATAFAPGNTAFLVPGKEVNVTAGTVKIGAANLLASVDGALVLGTFTFTTAAGFTTSTEATISASLISLGPSSSNRDIFNEAALGLSATVNPPAPAPTVASITPNSALVTGGVAVTIAGANFQDGATVTIGANAATNVKFVSATSLTATAPAGAVGAVDVVVANPDGQSATLAGGFTYLAIPPPTVTSITPNSASMTGGVAVTIAGANFQSGATVTIGGTAATNVKFVSATSLTATAPAGAAGAADVVVANPDGQSATLAGGFTYLSVIEPTLSRVGAADVSLDYSAIGEGEVQDGSAGEATFKVRFTGNKGAAVAGQAVSWAITNNGSETVYVVGGGSAEILSGDAQTIQVATDAEGGSVIVLDAQGGKQAGTTSVSIVASTTA